MGRRQNSFTESVVSMEKMLIEISKKIDLAYLFLSKGETSESIRFSPIGFVHSPYQNPRETPRQPSKIGDIESSVEIFPRFLQGLAEIERFSHIVLVSYLNFSRNFELMVTPRDGSNSPRGVFATRSPRRPNPIGISVVKLLRVEGRMLYIQDVYLLNNTPILDIKPFMRPQAE